MKFDELVGCSTDEEEEETVLEKYKSLVAKLPEGVRNVGPDAWESEEEAGSVNGKQKFVKVKPASKSGYKNKRDNDLDISFLPAFTEGYDALELAEQEVDPEINRLPVVRGGTEEQVEERKKCMFHISKIASTLLYKAFSNKTVEDLSVSEYLGFDDSFFKSNIPKFPNRNKQKVKEVKVFLLFIL